MMSLASIDSSVFDLATPMGILSPATEIKTTTDLGILFLNFILQPEMMARISNKVKFANANEQSKDFISQEILNNPTIYPSQETVKKLFIAEIANPRVDRMMTRQWINIKTNR